MGVMGSVQSATTHFPNSCSLSPLKQVIFVHILFEYEQSYTKQNFYGIESVCVKSTMYINFIIKPRT